MKIYDIVIIGAGVIGTSIARELSRYSLDIALLEKEEELSFGVSKSNSGIIHPGTQNSVNSLKGRLCVQGNFLIREIASDLGIDFKEVGELILAFTQEEVSRLHKLKEDAVKLGVKQLEIVHSDWLKENEPNLSSDVVAALYVPSAGIISPYRLVFDMAENALANGVEVYTNHKVENIEFVNERENKSDHIFDINTISGSYKARYVINAAGLYADDIANMVGINNFCIKPRKGEEYILDKKKEYIANHLLFPLPTKTSKGVLVIKTSDGNPMIEPTAEDCDSKEDLSTSDSGLQRVLKGVQRMIPVIQESDIIAYFAGLRPVAGDDFIIRYEDSVPGFINVAGIQSPGLTAAGAIALYVCEILKDHGLVLKKREEFIKCRKKTVHLFDIPLTQTKKYITKDSSFGDIVCRCEMVSKKEILESIKRGATTLDGVKFRTRAQAGRCHGNFCTTRILKILASALDKPITKITKKGAGSEVIVEERRNDT